MKTPRTTPPPVFSAHDAEQLSMALNILNDIGRAYDLTIHADVWSGYTSNVRFRKALRNSPHFDNGSCADRDFTGGINLSVKDLADMEHEAWEAAHKSREDREAREHAEEAAQ